MAILICILLSLAAVALIVGNLLEQRRRQRLVSQRLQGQLTREDKLGSLMRQLGASAVAQRSVSLDNETQTLLNRVGWRKANQRSMFAAFQIGVPIVLLGLTLLGQQLLFPHAGSPWIAPAIALGIGYLLPKRILDDIVEMIYALDKIAPGTANEDTLLYGVEVKFYNMEVEVNKKLESNQHPGLYIIGDGSGITHSLSHASASGVYVARNILE